MSDQRSGCTKGGCLFLVVLIALALVVVGVLSLNDRQTAATTPISALQSATVATSEPSYTDRVLRITGDYGKALDGIGQHFSDAGSDTSLLFDSNWKSETAIYLTMLQVSGNYLRSLTPPSEYVAFHAEMLDAAGHFDQVATLSAQGIDNLDMTKMDKAKQEVDQGSVAFQRALAEYKAVTAGRPAIAVSTRTASPSRTPVKTLVKPAAKGPTVKTAANLRAGPGTDYPKTGSAAVGQALNIVARNQASDWYQLATGAWIAAFLVNNPPAGVPVVTVSPPTPAAAVPVKVVAAPVLATPAPVKAAAVIQAGSENPNAFTCTGGCAVAPDQSCAIKGNVNSNHEKIYHTQGGAFYEKTDIKPEEGDRWFCTEAEAQAAGFRPSQR